jgi:ribulose-phosphate 3-epimerase
MTRAARIAPSVLSTDLGRLKEQIAQATEGGADWLHVDVMDGRFVPNLTFGAPLIKALRKISDLPLDVHLMVVEPENYIAEYADLGCTVFTFHPEATVHVQRHLMAVKEKGMKAGLALNPSTPLNAVDEVLMDLDLLLLMSVNPGFGGQKYIYASTDKIQRARNLLDFRRSAAILEVDGGIDPTTIKQAWMAGANTFVAGQAVFGQADPAAAIRALRRACAVEA